MAITLIEKGVAFWQAFRPNYFADSVEDIETNAETLAGNFVQLPDRSIYYVANDQSYFLAFDEVGRPVFIQGIIDGTIPITGP